MSRGRDTPATGGRDVTPPDRERPPSPGDGRFARAERGTPPSKPASGESQEDLAKLLGRVEEQAESLGRMKLRVNELETSAGAASAEVRDLKQKLRKERQRRKEQESAVSQLKRLLTQMRDESEALEIERQSVRNLEFELARAWAEVHTLRAELEKRNRTGRGLARRFLRRF
jgi:chromosome segregation ATPase